MASRLVTSFSRFLQWGNGQLLDVTRRDIDSLRPDWNNQPQDITKDVTYADWRSMLGVSRRLWSNNDIIKTATNEKAIHAVGRAWNPAFLGGNGEPAAIAWGERATIWLRESWYPVCDVRGANFDFKTDLYLDSISIDRDGDNSMLLTETSDGFPQIQRVAAHRIGQLGTSAHIVGEEAVTLVPDGCGGFTEVEGLYKGMRIDLGNIYNECGCAIAHRVIDQFGTRPQDISARDMDLRYDPEYVDQGRGFPAYSGSINELASSLKAHKYELQALENLGSIALLEFNEQGAADTSDAAVFNSAQVASATSANLPFMERLWGGTTRYINSRNPGNKLEAFSPGARPSQQWTDFNDRVIRAGISTIWPYSLTWKPDGQNGTQERSTIERARALVKDRQDLLLPRARRACAYAVSKAIKLGILPPYPGSDEGGFLKWGFEMPAEFSIDHGREDSQWLEMYRAGMVTAQQYLDANDLGSFKALCLARANEAADRLEIVKKVEAARGVQIDPRSIQMLTPNDQPVAANENQDPPSATPAAR